MEPVRKRVPINEIDPRKALYELQLYHEELELQNIELQQIRRENELLITKYTTLYNQSPSGYATLDRTEKILEMNSVMVSTFGKKYEDLIHQGFSQFIAEENRESFIDFFTEIFKNKHKVSCEVMLSLQSGSPVYAHIEGIATDDGQNCLLTMVDITVLKQTEEALKLSRKEFQSYFENGSVGMSVYSPNKGWMELNQKFCQMLAYTKEELIGINWMKISHPEDLPYNLELYHHALDGQIDRYQIEKRFIRKDGKDLYVNMAVACQRNEDGSIHHLLTTYIDITEQKLTEIALRQSEEKYRTLLEFAPDALFQGDQQGNLIMVNDKAVEFTGYSREELLKMNISELFSSDILDAKPLRYDLLTKEKVICNERTLLRKDGSTLEIEMNSTRMPDGTYQCLMKDISSRKLAEEALRESEERFKSIFEDSPDAILITDIKSELIIDANHAAEKLIGRNNDLIGIHYTELYPKEEREIILASFQEWIKKTSKKGPNPPVERTLLRADGKRIPVEVTSKVIVLNGKQVMHGTFRDISRRKQMDAALRESEKKYRLIAENSGDVIWILDLKTMRFRYVSPSVLALRGYTIEEVKAQDVSAALTPESLEIFRRILPERIEKFHKGSTGPYIDEIAQSCKNGKIVWTETMTRFMKSEDNNHLEILGVSRDISQRKLATESLQESEERFREIFECSPDASFIADAETGMISNANLAAGRLLKKDPKDIIGKHQTTLHPPRMEEMVKDLFQQHLKKRHSEKSMPVESVVIRSDGKEIPVEILSTILRLNGKKILFGTFRDLSSRKKAEEKLAKSEMCFASLFKNMPEGFAFCKMIFQNNEPDDFIYLNVNSSFEKLTGLRNVTGKKVSTILPDLKASNPDIFRIYGRVAQSGIPEQFETIILTLNKRFRISVHSPSKDHFVSIFDQVYNEENHR